MAEPVYGKIDAALKDGLLRQPSAQVSPDFDERVLAALRGPRSWWQVLFLNARPVVSAAACSMVLTLAAMHWAIPKSAPADPGLRAPAAATAVSPAQSGVMMAALNQALDRPDLRFGTVIQLLAPAKPAEPVAAAPPATRSSPGRRREPPSRDSRVPTRDCVLA